MCPERIPDLFGAQPPVICGRYQRGQRALLRVHAKAAGRDFVRAIRIPLPDEEPRHPALEQLWAPSRIAALTAQNRADLQKGSRLPDIRDAITELGRAHRLVTPFTSFAAVEERTVNESGKTVRYPVESGFIRNGKAEIRLTPAIGRGLLVRREESVVFLRSWCRTFPSRAMERPSRRPCAASPKRRHSAGRPRMPIAR